MSRAPSESADRILRHCARDNTPDKRSRGGFAERARNRAGNSDICRENGGSAQKLGRADYGSVFRRRFPNPRKQHAIPGHGAKFCVGRRGIGPGNERVHEERCDRSRLDVGASADLAKSICADNPRGRRSSSAVDSTPHESYWRFYRRRCAAAARALSAQARRLGRMVGAQPSRLSMYWIGFLARL
jgi:hypothetical protein